MKRALWPSVATLGAAMVIYADATYPGMPLGGRVTAAMAVMVLPMIAWIAAYRRRSSV